MPVTRNVLDREEDWGEGPRRAHGLTQSTFYCLRGIHWIYETYMKTGITQKLVCASLPGIKTLRGLPSAKSIQNHLP